MAQIFDLTSPSPPSAKKQKIVANNENRERNGTAYTEESQGILGAAATASPAQSDSCDVIDLTQVSPSALLRMTESLGSPGMNVGGTANPFLFSLPIDGSAPASPASPQTDGYGRGGQGSQHSAHGYSCEYYGDDQSYNDYINNQRTQSQSQPDVSELPLCGPEGNDIDLGAPPVLRDEMGVCGPDLSSAESSPAVSRSCVPQRRATARVSRAPRAGGSRLAVPVWDSSDDSVVYSPEPTDAERTRAEHIRTLAEEVKGSQSCVGLSQTSEFIAKLAVIREEQIAHGTSATMPVVSATGIRISLSSSTGVASVSAAVPDVAARTRPSRGTDRSPSNPSVPAAAATAARGLSTTLVRAEAPGPLNRDDNTARGSSSTGSGSAVCGATACVASDVASSTPVAAVPALVPFPPTKLPLLSIPVAERAGYEVLLLIDYREQDGKNIRARVYNLPDGTCIPCAIVGLCLGDYCWGIRRRIPASSAPPGVNAEQLDAHGNDTSNPNPIYMLSAVAERKTIADLVSSIMDGRFLEQKLRLRALGDGLGRFRDHPCAYISQKYYIVEGGTTAYNPNLARRGGAPAKNYYRTGQGQGGAAGAAQAAARAMGGIGSREVKSAIMATQVCLVYSCCTVCVVGLLYCYRRVLCVWLPV